MNGKLTKSLTLIVALSCLGFIGSAATNTSEKDNKRVTDRPSFASFKVEDVIEQSKMNPKPKKGITIDPNNNERFPEDSSKNPDESPNPQFNISFSNKGKEPGEVPTFSITENMNADD